MISSSQKETVSWSTLKIASNRDRISLFYVEKDAPSMSYSVYGANSIYFLESHITGNQNGDDGYDFYTNYKNNATVVASRADALVLSQPPINSLGAHLVEITSNLSQDESYTIVTHDYSEPCTWYQNSTQITQEVLSTSGSGIYSSAHALWINTEHPKLMADQYLNPGWAAGGYQNQDFWYYSWWMPNGTLNPRTYYHPIIEVQPGGSGGWITADPASTASPPNYSYTIDYTNGQVHFNDITNWPGGTLVRASYFYAQINKTGSTFQIGPPTGKIWYLIRTEVQMSTSPSWRDTVIFELSQYGVIGGQSYYRSYNNMQSTAMEAVITEGATGTGVAWPAAADNGWTFGGCDGARGSTKSMETNRWIYDKPYALNGNLLQKIAVSLQNGIVFTETDTAQVTFYFREIAA